MPEEIDPVALTLMIIYNSIILGMILKWLIPELRKIREAIIS
ncbi:MAG: hypothetical protein QXK24_08860 [Ignisphaera sp.]